MHALVMLCAVAAVPRPDWMTQDLLKSVIGEAGYGVEERGQRLMVTVSSDKKVAYADWGEDGDSVKFVAVWGSPQTGLQDFPFINTWNTDRRFCKVSIVQHASGDTTLMVMHHDQMIWLRDKEASSPPLTRLAPLIADSLTILKASVVEFDAYIKGSYTV